MGVYDGLSPVFLPLPVCYVGAMVVGNIVVTEPDHNGCLSQSVNWVCRFLVSVDAIQYLHNHADLSNGQSRETEPDVIVGSCATTSHNFPEYADMFKNF